MILIKPEKSGFSLHSEIIVQHSISVVFPFFSDAINLESITPQFLNFKILSTDLSMRTGLKIDYKLSLFKLPFRWRSLISAWEPPHRFVDEQLKGPYKYWIHEHSFVEIDEGTKIIDYVKYDLFGGSLIHDLFVKPNLLKIFEYRSKVIREKFQ